MYREVFVLEYEIKSEATRLACLFTKCSFSQGPRGRVGWYQERWVGHTRVRIPAAQWHAKQHTASACHTETPAPQIRSPRRTHARAAGNHGSRTSARRGLSLPIFRAGPRLRNALAPTEHAELAPADKPAGPGPPWAVPLAKPAGSTGTGDSSSGTSTLPTACALPPHKAVRTNVQRGHQGRGPGALGQQDSDHPGGAGQAQPLMSATVMSVANRATGSPSKNAV